MKEEKRYNQDELKKCVQNYEVSVLNATEEAVVIDSPFFVRYKTMRRSKLVVIEAIRPLNDIIDDVKEKAVSFLDSDNTLSENIELFTLSVIPDSQRIEYGSLFMKDGLSLTITDRLQMESIDCFTQLFKLEDDKVDDDSSLYEYLSMSNETSDVKTSLFYALLLMMIYKNKGVTKESLEQMMLEKYGKNIGDIPLALKALRRQKKIAEPGRGGLPVVNR